MMPPRFASSCLTLCFFVASLVSTVPASAGCPDVDGDGICDADDNCPLVVNPSQIDFDGDGLGDVCDADDDNDGVSDVADSNPLNRFICRDVDGDACDDCSSGTDDPFDDGPDFDGDGQCNLGDADDDNDGIPDAIDPCPLDPTNSCGCPDADGDGVCDPDDFDPFDPFVCRDVEPDTCDDCSSGTDNPANDGPDFDGDGICDPGDIDDDNDGIPDGSDPCPLDPTNTCGCPDADGDGICDADDNCPFVTNPDQSDFDGDGLGDVCDADDDNDGVSDVADSNPLNGFVCRDVDGDACDDCSSGTDDLFDDGPDFDGDGQCNLGDADDDNDGIPDAIDPCPLDPTNSCGCPDADGDGVCDPDDFDPFDPFVCRDVEPDTCDDCSSGTDNPANDGPDFDGDGICDPGDIDDDNDGIPDGSDPCPLDPTNTCGCPDVDFDAVCDSADNCPFTANPAQVDTDGDGAGDVCDCDPLDATAGRPPAVDQVVAESMSGSVARFVWSPTFFADRYEILRGSVANPDGAICWTQNDPDPTDTQYDEPAMPLPGDSWFFLIRGVDDACGGPGPWSGGTIGGDCP